MTKRVIDLLDEKVIEFNSRIDDEPQFSKMIEGKNRTICISVTDEENYSTKLEDMRIEDFVSTENLEADLVVTANAKTFIGLIGKEISPIKAYMSGDLKVKASLTDMLLLKRLF
tara:strand:- start:165 stop:506 length:342 start_codon:yes stop_codon:yes gene_type:complete